MTVDIESHAERVAAVLRHGWDGDRVLGRRIVDRYPDIARENLCCAATVGDVDEVRRRLADDPALANTAFGSREWTPLTYVTYGRLDAQHAVSIARLLLDAGADPNFGFDDGWGSPFKVLTGAIGLGEGVKPTHPQAIALVELLIGAGADPYDLQALYNSSIVDDDICWMDLLWRHCEHQGRSTVWSQTELPSLGGRFKVGTLNYLLGNAVGQNQLQRAMWLLDHGADATTIHAYSGQQVHTTARLSGFLEMASLLERYGAVAERLTGALAFQAALMRGDEAEVRSLAARNPAMLSSSAALLSVAAAGRAEAAKLLLDLGVRVDGVDHDGISPLHRAAQAGSLATVEVLLAAGADVNLREHKWHGTPLSWATVFRQPLVAQRLESLSRDVRALAANGCTARLETVLREDASLANHTLTRVDNPTPLFCLPDDEDLAATIAQILLANGANPKVKDAKGRTPADVARFRGLVEAADLLAPA